MFNNKKDKQNQTSLEAKAVTTLLFLWVGSLYAGTVGNLWQAWSSEDYSHGYLIPIIALVWALLLLQQKPFRPTPSLLGVWILAAGFMLKFIGEIVSNNWLSQISLLFSIVGLVVLFFGFSVLKRIAAPLFFLIFAVPLPVTIAPLLTAKMQLLSSDIGTTGLQWLGIAVYQEGNIIDLGGYKLQVAEACSGLRYLFPLMSLGYLIAFHAVKKPWKRGLVFLSTMPIAILVNGARITLTGVAVNWGGVRMAEGALHELEGFIVFTLCLFCLVLVVWGVNRLGKREVGATPEDFFFTFNAPIWTSAPRLSRTIIGLVLFVLILSTAISFALETQSAKRFPDRRSFVNFPLHISNWSGTPASLSTDDLKSLKLSDYLLVDYVQERTSFPVTFYIAYYESQHQGSSTHSPQICLPGAGWEIVSNEIKTVTVKTAPPMSIELNREIIQRGDAKQLVYYWFREGGEDVATNMQIKWQMIKSALRSHRTDGSLIRLTTPIVQGQSLEQADAMLSSFMEEALPLLPSYLPAE